MVSCLAPVVIGTKRYCSLKQSVQELLGDLSRVSIVLVFGKSKDELPSFGFTAFGIKELFWEVVKNDGEITSLPFITYHDWYPEDGFDKQEFGNCSPVYITFDRDAANQSIFNVTWTYKMKSSLTYSYQLDGDGKDLYLLIFHPLEDFQIGRYTLYSTVGYMKALIDDINESKKSTSLVSNDCVACHSCVAEYAIIPCGHFAFCSDCIDSYKSPRCPICQEYYEFRARAKMMSFCMTCPANWGCKRMDCMLSPCSHVIGCIKSAHKAIRIGDPCPCRECCRKIDRITKVYSQTEGT